MRFTADKKNRDPGISLNILIFDALSIHEINNGVFPLNFREHEKLPAAPAAAPAAAARTPQPRTVPFKGIFSHFPLYARIKSCTHGTKTVPVPFAV